MSFTLDTSKLTAKIGRLNEAALREARTELRQQLHTLRNLIVEKAPVDTGELKASYKISGYSVVSTNDHAYYQEFGTRYHAPQAHMRPAVDERRRPYFDGIGQAVSRAMKNG